MGSHVCLRPEIWPFFGGAGGHSIGWQPVLLVRNPTDKKMPIFLCFVTVPMSRFSSKTDRGWPLAPTIGAVRTEKTSGGKLQNTGILGHFGPGRLLALREILGLDRKHNLPVLGALLGGESGRPNSFSLKVHNFLHFTFWPTGPPRAEKREIRFLRPFWPRTALGTERNSGGENQKNTISQC